MKLVSLFCLLLLCTGCTVSGYALGEGFDRRARETVAVPQDSLQAQLVEGAHMQIELTSGEVLVGNVIQLDEDAVLLNQWESFPWPNGGRIERRLPLTEIEDVWVVSMPVRWRIAGTFTGVVIDSSLLMLFFAFHAISASLG